MTKKSLTDRLIVALGLALEEIRKPGCCATAGLDVIAMCKGVINEATGSDGAAEIIAEELHGDGRS